MNAVRWLEYGEPIGDRVEIAIRTTYETGPSEEPREDDVERGTLAIDALDLIHDDPAINDHLHSDGSVMLSGLTDSEEGRLLESFERDSWDKLEGLVRDRGLSNAAAVDYVATEERGLSQSEWARRREVAQQVVNGNVQTAREELHTDE